MGFEFAFSEALQALYPLYNEDSEKNPPTSLELWSHNVQERARRYSLFAYVKTPLCQ